jgi:hypothetical protein
MSCYANSGQNQRIKTANVSFEYVAKFKHLGKIFTKRNNIHNEIKSRLNPGNACPKYFVFILK